MSSYLLVVVFTAFPAKHSYSCPVEVVLRLFEKTGCVPYKNSKDGPYAD